jgi:hypothetical protein
MLESEEKHFQSEQKDVCHKLQLFCTTGTVALWSLVRDK